MCQDDGTKQALPTPMTSTSRKSAPRKKHQYGNRGSWIRFITNSFHGVLGSFSLLVTLSAWISNEYYESTSTLPVVLTLLSVFTTTVLSIHSSWYMLEQSPYQSTILDWQLNTMHNTKENTKNVSPSRENSVRIRVVAPHRGAFHRTSIIMQYANSRILLLLQRRHWHDPSPSATSTSSILVWGLVFVMCLRMLLGEKMPSFSIFKRLKAATTTKRKTIASMGSSKNNKEMTIKPLPPFWKNGNTYCFVLPMIASVCADFVMSAWCEVGYFSSSLSNEKSLFDFYSDNWLSLWHMLFLQVVAHIIAFSFTVAFRIKHTSKKTENTPSRTSSLARKFYNIKTLYWACTIGVYALALVGLGKAKSTIQVLMG